MWNMTKGVHTYVGYEDRIFIEGLEGEPLQRNHVVKKNVLKVKYSTLQFPSYGILTYVCIHTYMWI